jgi:hypothetical protein
VELGPFGSTPVNVANTGIDSPGCGTTGQPCRSITQAVANGVSPILVGPGRYGDLNRNGQFGAAGDVGEDPLLDLLRAVVLESRNGAGATVVESGFFVKADGVTIGTPGRGFTLLGHDDRMTLGSFGNDTRAGYNVLLGELGIRIWSNRARVEHNLVVGGVEGVNSVGDTFIFGNLAIGNLDGFVVDGGTVLTSVAAACAEAGFQAGIGLGDDGITLQENISAGNGTRNTRYHVDSSKYSGVFVFGSGRDWSFNTVVGNRGPGIRSEVGSFHATGNDIYGNNDTPAPVETGDVLNCGLLLLRGATVTDHSWNYWGAPFGPGANPADAVCARPVVAIQPSPYLQRHAIATPLGEPRMSCLR